MKRSSFFAVWLLGCLCANPAAAQTFEVRRVSDDSLAFSGLLAKAPASPDLPAAQLADFSTLSSPGEYYLSVRSSERALRFALVTTSTTAN